MIYEPIVFPNAEGKVAGYLRTVLGEQVENRVPNPRVGTFLVVRRVGGVTETIVSDAASLAVEAWDETDAAAHDLCALARAWILALPGEVLAGTPVYRVDEIAGPANLPDPLSDHHRWTFTVAVHLRGTAV
jgi:hypothetical protein